MKVQIKATDSVKIEDREYKQWDIVKESGHKIGDISEHGNSKGVKVGYIVFINHLNSTSHLQDWNEVTQIINQVWD